MNAHLDLASLRRDAEMLDELCGGDERLFADMMEGETDIDRIIGRFHEQLSQDEEMLVGIKERKAALIERERRIKARHDNAKGFIGKALRAARLSKIELPEATYSVRVGKAKLDVADPTAVPDEYQVPKFVPDKAAINEAYADADELPNWLTRIEATDIVTARTK